MILIQFSHSAFILASYRSSSLSSIEEGNFSKQLAWLQISHKDVFLKLVSDQYLTLPLSQNVEMSWLLALSDYEVFWHVLMCFNVGKQVGYDFFLIFED